MEYYIVIVDFEVEFSDVETRQCYESCVDDLKKSLARINGVDENDLVAKTIFKIDEKQNLKRKNTLW